jgi:peroxiredoxin
MVAMQRLLRRAVPAGALVLALAGCSGGSTVDTSVDASLGFQPGDGAVVFASGHRYPAGDVSGPTLTGGHASLAALRGKVVVVNFWESDCVPCREEAPWFNVIARADAKRGVAFLGIDDRDQRARAETFESAEHVPYPSIFDPDGSLTLQFPHAVPAATPTTIVIDRAGDIAAKVSGALDYTHLRALVNAVLQDKA